MVTFILAALLLISIGINICFLVLVKRLLFKISVHEQWIIDFREDVTNALELLREIDKQEGFATRVNDKGVLESDDEIGRIFKDFVVIIDELNQKIQ